MGEFEKFDRYNSEDYICGSLNDGKMLVMSEVTTKRRETDSKGRTHYVTVFQGLFAKIELDKYIDSTTRIRKNKFKLIDHQNSLEMDSGEFERIFDVYSEGKIETMQMLTLDTMQYIIDFKNKTKLVPEFTIKENSVYIRFYMGDVFEGNVLKKSLDYSILKKYYDIFNFIPMIINEFLKNLEGEDI